MNEEEQVKKMTFDEYKQAVLDELNKTSPDIIESNKELVRNNEDNLRYNFERGWTPSFVAMAYNSPVY